MTIPYLTEAELTNLTNICRQLKTIGQLSYRDIADATIDVLNSKAALVALVTEAPKLPPAPPEFCEWFDGYPKEVGWYPASTINDPQALRYFNGEYLSTHVSCYEKNIEVIKNAASIKSDDQEKIKWAKPWW